MPMRYKQALQKMFCRFCCEGRQSKEESLMYFFFHANINRQLRL